MVLSVQWTSRGSVLLARCIARCQWVAKRERIGSTVGFILDSGEAQGVFKSVWQGTLTFHRENQESRSEWGCCSSSGKAQRWYNEMEDQASVGVMQSARKGDLVTEEWDDYGWPRSSSEWWCLGSWQRFWSSQTWLYETGIGELAR